MQKQNSVADLAWQLNNPITTYIVLSSSDMDQNRLGPKSQQWAGLARIPERGPKQGRGSVT